MSGRRDTRLTDDEYRQLLRLLRRWCDTELDQFEHLVIPSRYGDVYAAFGREPISEQLAENYVRVADIWLAEDDQ